MREILFRGKRKDNGLWVYGDLRQYSETHKGIYDYDLRQTVKGIIPETVGQYTGLTDKNGKNIFEGDICLCDRNINDHIDKKAFIVEFESFSGWFGISTDGCSEFNGSAWECAEVIGNIHDNPELLN